MKKLFGAVCLTFAILFVSSCTQPQTYDDETLENEQGTDMDGLFVRSVYHYNDLTEY